MSAKRNGVVRKPAIDRPFRPSMLARARAIADQYQVVLACEDGEYYGRGLELPGTMDDGRTPDECVAKVREALTATVAYLLEKGEEPPRPLRERTESINVRVTADEKTQLEAAARRLGIAGVSDFVRDAATRRASELANDRSGRPHFATKS
jgi:predicted RNase H-like HicB family nuclease